jgi:hypothetical protein
MAMADFRLWATVTQIGPSEFAVVVTAIEHDGPVCSTQLRTAPSREDALALRARLLVSVGAEVIERGDRVCDVDESD